MNGQFVKSPLMEEKFKEIENLLKDHLDSNEAENFNTSQDYDEFIKKLTKPLNNALDLYAITKVGNCLLNDLIQEFQDKGEYPTAFDYKAKNIAREIPDVFGNRLHKLGLVDEITYRNKKNKKKKAGRSPEFDTFKNIGLLLVKLANKKSNSILENPANYPNGGTAYHEASDNLKKLGVNLSPKALFKYRYESSRLDD